MQQTKFTRIAKQIVYILSLIFAVCFAIMGVLSQVKIDMMEVAYLSHTNIIIMAAGVIACIVIIWALLLLSRVLSKRKITPNIVFGIVLAIGFFWVLVSQNAPTDDADHCMKIAEELCEGITKSFVPGQYMDVWRQQNFLVLYMCVLTLIGGMYNYVLFQMINALLFAWMCREVYAYITSREGVGEANTQIAITSFILMLLYTPTWMSVTYVYGNLAGLVFAVIALLRQLRFFKTEARRDAIWAAIYMAIAIAFKMFVIIFLMAMVIMYIWHVIETRKFKTLIWAGLMLICYIGLTKVSDGVMGVASGHVASANGGMPMYASIVMGTDIDESMTNPGWYSAYNIGSYFDSNCDKQTTAARNKEDLSNALAKAKGNPTAYLRALAKKAHTVWNEPTFDVLYRGRLETDTQISDHADWYNDLMADSGRSHRILVLFLQCMQVVIYLGVIVYVIMEAKASAEGAQDYHKLTGLIIFIGGVLFMVFWEAKSEYVMPYFVPLMVYAVIGFENLFETITDKCTEIFTEKKSIKFSIKRISVIACIEAIAIFVTVVYTLIFMPRTTDDAAWNEYIKNFTYVSSDKYSLTTQSGKTCAELQDIYIDFDALYGTIWSYGIYDNSQRYYFEFQSWDEIDQTLFPRYIISEEGDLVKTKALELNTEGDMTEYADPSNSFSRWHIYRQGGGYIISSMTNYNLVWTMDEQAGSVVLRNYEKDNSNQIWEFN